MSTNEKTAAAGYVFPDPVINPESKAYWEAAQSGRLMIGRCRSCQAAHHYPRALCPRCFSPEVQLEASSGRGEIYSVSITRRGVPAPYAIAYVKLEEGVTLLTHIVDTAFDAIRIGAPVHVAFRASKGGQQVPVFVLSGE